VNLLTLVHVSDVHFGDLSLAEDAPMDSEASRWWRHHARFDGFHGHHHAALVHLRQRYAELRRTLDPDEQLRLVVTGDLTAFGGAMQFQLARQYLEDAIALGRGNRLGLELPDGLELAIPGNHDHWPGDRTIFGEETHGLGHLFPERPFVAPPIRVASGVKVVVAGIDSDADTRPWGPARFTARGHFESQLAALAPRLGAPSADEIRVLLVHHSRMHSTSLGVEMMGGDSQEALDEFMRAHDIAVLLTGHVHHAEGDVWTVDDGKGRQWQALEVRCGTTTQRDKAPRDWKLTPEEEIERFPTNTLVVHRLTRTGDGGIEWSAAVEERNRFRGFRRGKPLGAAVRVWPRP
jgi:hypothetical protein